MAVQRLLAIGFYARGDIAIRFDMGGQSDTVHDFYGQKHASGAFDGPNAGASRHSS